MQKNSIHPEVKKIQRNLMFEKVASDVLASRQTQKDELLMKLADTLIKIHQAFVDKVDALDYIINEKIGPKGENGKDGSTPTKQDLIKLMEEYIPEDGHTPTDSELLDLITPLIPDPIPGQDAEFDIEKISDLAAKKAVKLIKIPKVKDGLPGKDAESIDHEKIIEGILSKKKIKATDIDGYENAESVLRRYIANGSRHGAGDTVQGGFGVVITTLSNGNKVISVSGVGISIETPTGLINGTNPIFTVLHTPKYITINGLIYYEDDGYTLSGLTITINSQIIPVSNSTLRSIY